MCVCVFHIFQELSSPLLFSGWWCPTDRSAVIDDHSRFRGVQGGHLRLHSPHYILLFLDAADPPGRGRGLGPCDTMAAAAVFGCGRVTWDAADAGLQEACQTEVCLVLTLGGCEGPLYDLHWGSMVGHHCTLAQVQVILGKRHTHVL